MSLSFLKGITLKSNEEVKPAFITTKAARPSIDRSPVNADLRVFKDGSIYPSKALVEKFNLEYVGKDHVYAEGESQANGFDIVSSKTFPNTSHLEASFLLIGVVPKSLPKVDVFGSTTYVSDKDVEKDSTLVLNAAKSSVLDQGANTFGKEVLIPMLKEVYGFEFGENDKFVDLIIVSDQPLVTSDGNYFIPKRITRGEKKGQLDIVVRQNIDLFPLVLAAAMAEENGSEMTDSAPQDGTPELRMTEGNITPVEPSIDDIVGEDESEPEDLTIDGADEPVEGEEMAMHDPEEGTAYEAPEEDQIETDVDFEEEEETTETSEEGDDEFEGLSI
jgi:hypothetical protein